MSDDIKNILNLYESILKNKKNITEAPLSAPIPILNVNSKFGEQRPYERHPGVDLKAASGTEIKSPADGVVIDVKDDSRRCGGTIYIDHQNGFKTRYCHVKDIRVSKFDKVSEGDLIGLSGGASGDKGRGNSKGAHLHFEVYKDGKLVNPMDYIDYSVATKDSKYDTSELLKYILSQLSSLFTITESKIYGSFGNSVKSSGNSFILSKEKNESIYSPISGKVDNIRINSDCKNRITIYHNVDGDDYHLEFCGISNPYVSGGDSVSQGTKLGKTKDDVKITLYDERLKPISLKTTSKVEKSKEIKSPKKIEKPLNQDSIKKEINRKEKSMNQNSIWDLIKSLKNKFVSPTSKKQPDPGFLLNMLKNKKVNEDVKRIKKLLK
jgi:biotin carboxyl carrier protein